ncbi:MAG: class II fructose-bisphosphate aldolase [Saccharofermentanales bacterium]
MPLVSMKEMLIDAMNNKYAVGAFNIENMEMAQAVIEAASAMSTPVIIQTTQSTLKYAPPAVYACIVRMLAESADIPVAIHLDHSQSVELIHESIQSGYTSVMYDGSAEDYKTNKDITARVCRFAHELDISVEAELGRIGGKEDDISGDKNYTDPGIVGDFVSGTGIDALAVSIGTAHGFYKGVPKLDLELLSEIRSLTDIPLVLHGASGLTDEVVRETICRGISKINFATELRAAFTDGVKEYLASDPTVFDPKKYLSQGRLRVKQLVEMKISVCGSGSKAL